MTSQDSTTLSTQGTARPLRFIHEDGQGKQTVVPSPFESDRPNEVRGFVVVQRYWDSQLAKGGDAAATALKAQEYLRMNGANIPHTQLTEDVAMEEEGAIEEGDEVSEVSKKKRGPRRKYRIYTTEQIHDMIAYYLNDNLSKAAASEKAGIVPRTGVSLINRYLKDEEKRIPVKSMTRKRGPKTLLGPEHKEFVIRYLEEQPEVFLAEVMEAIKKEFSMPKLAITTVSNYIKDEVRFSLKRVRNVTDMRNHPDVLEERKTWCMEWKEREEDFFFRSVFVDEAGFNRSMNRGYGWSRKGTRCNVRTPTSKGENISIIGAISAVGILNLASRVPVADKNRPVPIAPVDCGGGTTTNTFRSFIISLLDIMDGMNMVGYNIIADNCQIHKHGELVKMIRDRGYRLVFLPRYSPFLNPIEEFWSRLKFCYKTNKGTDGVVSRVEAASEEISVDNIHSWINHAISYFPRCIQKEIDL